MNKQSHSLTELHSFDTSNGVVSPQHCFQHDILNCDLTRIIFSAKMLQHCNSSKQVASAELRTRTTVLHIFLSLHFQNLTTFYLTMALIYISWRINILQMVFSPRLKNSCFQYRLKCSCNLKKFQIRMKFLPRLNFNSSTCNATPWKSRH